MGRPNILWGSLPILITDGCCTVALRHFGYARYFEVVFDLNVLSKILARVLAMLDKELQFYPEWHPAL